MIRQTPSIAYPKNGCYSFEASIPVKFLPFFATHAAAGPVLLDAAKADNFDKLELKPASNTAITVGYNDDAAAPLWSAHRGRRGLARDLSEKMSMHEPLQSLLCDPVRNHSFVTQLWYESGNSLISEKIWTNILVDEYGSEGNYIFTRVA